MEEERGVNITSQNFQKLFKLFFPFLEFKQFQKEAEKI